ncbi:tetratricopeptide repeat protein [Undibacterium umbellatum]|uniref:Tetratricopeptide repeat protein n=1 Tax=Undibacterium umbellatum TaxID=2762300 RepID=A0ABR6Z3U5_9BURK|nr:tetratricopeptide repeat protein [Undibacterium umbellatum]MBC3906453.1 tetratricopeptide repeat protein [Undibacterium umbellatum]
MKTWIILFFTCLLTACATPATQKLGELHFHDQEFAPSSIPIDKDNVLTVSKEMKSYLHQEIMPQLSKRGPQRALFEALSSKRQIKLEYDAEMTRNAAQAFAARSGNCLSLVLMTAAFAKQLGLDVQYQNVLINESWSRNNDLYFAAGHVNIVLGRRPGFLRNADEYHQRMVIDFLPPGEILGQKTVLISEATVIAMYMNNRAAELLAQHNVNDAYWFAREALRTDPDFLTAYNTLGVIYRQHGNFQLAENVFKQILTKEPDNTLALSNLAEVLRKSGRPLEAQVYFSRLEELQPYPPFHFFNRGLAAMQRGDFAEAKTLFKREIKRDANYDEFHLWLALAHLKLGEIPDATEELLLAKANSTTRKAHDLYVGKLERIKSTYTH